MQFITPEFFLFFVAILFCAVFLKSVRPIYRLYLLLVSLGFYYLFGVNGFMLLAANLIANYVLLFVLAKIANPGGKRFVLGLSVLLNVGFLGYFKYTNFVTDTISEIAHSIGLQGLTFDIEVFAPVGISFYIFRVISHSIDVYRRQVELPDFFSYALYITFFPQIMAGPIMRAQEFYFSLNKPRRVVYSDGSITLLVLGGLLKKLVIASYLWEFTQNAFTTPQAFSSLDLIIAALAYSCLIYTDFSGYSDLSIAISNLLGFEVKANFNSPYRAIGMKDFWNRWHISLSSWLKDYVYIPLGGSKNGKFRKYYNIVLTMLLSGLWHGAGLTYLVWGLLHGVANVATHIIGDIFAAAKSKFFRFYPFKLILLILGWLLTFTFVTFSWIFFNSRTLNNAWDYVNGIFNSGVAVNTLIDYKLFGVIGLVLLFNFAGEKFGKFFVDHFDKSQLLSKFIVLIIAIYVILSLGPDIVPPFIYFNF